MNSMGPIFIFHGNKIALVGYLFSIVGTLHVLDLDCLIGFLKERKTGMNDAHVV